MSESPAGPIFVDTNVLLYWLDAAEGQKYDRATLWMRALWQSGSGRISWQVIQEFNANAIKRRGVSTSYVRRVIGELAGWGPPTVNLALLERSWFWVDQAQTSIWDSLIVAAAEQCGAKWILSEDFQAGMRFGEMTVVDPFAHTPAEFGFIVLE